MPINKNCVYQFSIYFNHIKDNMSLSLYTSFESLNWGIKVKTTKIKKFKNFKILHFNKKKKKKNVLFRGYSLMYTYRYLHTKSISNRIWAPAYINHAPFSHNVIVTKHIVQVGSSKKRSAAPVAECTRVYNTRYIESKGCSKISWNWLFWNIKSSGGRCTPVIQT